MPLEFFHPVIASWFEEKFKEPTDVQVRSWPAIRSGADVLIAAPTGSGKTLAAFLNCIDDLFKKAASGKLDDRTHVVYISPLKALSNDVQKNLQQPLAEIADRALNAGLLMPRIRVTVRTGDTPNRERQLMLKRPPHILITTPESLYLLLTAEKSRNILRDVETVIVDEIHAVAPNKRGSHLALSLERLDALTTTKPVRIGLSATQRPIETVADFLVGQRRKPTIIDIGHRRQMDLAVEVPKDELGGVATNAIWSDIYDRLATLVHEHRSTLVFVNTRRLVERISHHLEERLKDSLGPKAVAAHHGSLSRQLRLSAEQRLKSGETRVVIATASLELGIDVGTVDLVCQVGSPRSIAVALQRIGRSGHWVGAMPKGRLFCTTRDELVECAALIRAIRSGELDKLRVPGMPLDIVAQQIVAAAATGEWREDELFEMLRRAYPYRDLERKDFDNVLQMLSDGVSSRRGRGGSAFVHHDKINHRIRARRGARLAAITSGGAIPDTANYAVVAEPEGTVVGSVDEDFAIESLAGDIILLGNASWRIRGVETGRVRVEDAHGAPPTIPFWNGEAPSRTIELSAEVAGIRKTVSDMSAGAASQWLQLKCGLDRRGAEQVVAYIQDGQTVLGTVPTQDTIIAERFFDEGGGMQLVLHAPFGGRINRAWGLALRKRFCVSFDFELQAAATDEGIVVSLGERHSFPLDTIFQFLHPNTLRETLTQAVLQAPMFATRWRWNATRSLALLRFANGKRVPPQIQRMRSEDLLTAVFPAATACQDNHQGTEYLEPPDHPLVNETIRDCLTEAMDIDGLSAVLERIISGDLKCIAIDTPAPSVFCHEILNANPYAYLDDAPLEERRARAVEMRRTLPPELAGQLGALDPDAIAEVAAGAWPVVRDADELHDALLTLVWIPDNEVPEGWREFLPVLSREGRCIHQNDGFVPTERATSIETLAIVRGWMESTGPTTSDQLATRLHLSADHVDSTMLQLESEGQVLRGRFRSSSQKETIEWCDRRLLARIHRLTIGRLRKEIEPVSAAQFMRFLFQWQHVASSSKLHGEDGLREIIGQLAGYEAAASAWERHILPTRMSKYDPDLLDRLCFGGSTMWARLSPHAGRVSLTAAASISLFPRDDAEWLLHPSPDRVELGPIGSDVRRFLQDRGASWSLDIVRGTGHTQSEVEDALWELSATGLVTADGFENLRSLLERGRRKPNPRDRRHRNRPTAGRWSLLIPHRGETAPPAERIARQLLKRYGVVFRDLLGREALDVAWRDLLVQYRRMELRGEIRGGRFVNGFVGEQFALPEAVESLRSLRRANSSVVQEVRIAAADPLNLVGVILPGSRVASTSNSFIEFRDGVPVEEEDDEGLELKDEDSYSRTVAHQESESRASRDR